MGARGPVEKRTGRQRRNPSKVVELASGQQSGDIPPPERGWLAPIKNRWAAFWASDLSQLILAADEPALRRMFGLMDERDRLWPQITKVGHLVMGSQGQPVLNPLLKRVEACDKEVRALEDRFGCTPGARLRIGAALGEAAKSLEKLNRGWEDEGGDEGEGDEPDPRSGAIDV